MTSSNFAIKLSALFTIAVLGSAIAGSAVMGQTAYGQSPAAPPPVKPAPATIVSPIEVAGTFTYLHTNAPPSGCGCFSMYGASGSTAYYFGPHFALVADLAFVHQGNVNNTGKSLNFASYLFGARVPVPLHNARVVPFGQVLLGFTHDSGPIALVSATNFQAASVVSAAAGGGLDYRLTPRITLRAVEVDYLLTRFPNGVNGRQNNLRLNSGLTVRF